MHNGSTLQAKVSPVEFPVYDLRKLHGQLYGHKDEFILGNREVVECTFMCQGGTEKFSAQLGRECVAVK